MSKVWMISGASRGIGLEMARAALRAGHSVVATGRRAEAVEAALSGEQGALLTVALDVTRGDQIAAAVEMAVSRFGRIDVLVNNAGYGQLGLFEECSAEEVRQQFDTNVFGLMALTRAVLPVMRRQRGGHLFNITSIGGLLGAPAGSLYCASKFAVEGFSESLAAELADFGIGITLVEPGYFRTDFLDERSLRYGTRRIADYAQRSTELEQYYKSHSHRQAGDPVKLASALLQLSEAPAKPLRFCAGTDAVGMIAQKLASLQAELDAWRNLSVSTDGDFGAA
ncbi:oxidoreductase [Niveibacterium sp. SC-1]|uniref:oxidoreductase n=1 Tax=Niveibacterium sp. SC-1 TaxID=3135646 RepID=UPI00311DC01F